MATAVNVSGSNPGPNSGLLPDTVQAPVGNFWKVGTFNISLTPAALGAGPAVTERAFIGTAATADGTHYFPSIGLLLTDIVIVTYAGAQTATVAILDSRVSAVDTLAIKFLNTAGTPTPAAGTAAAPYQVTVWRVQPLWTAPVSGSQLDW